MPEISRWDGMIVTIKWRDHPWPHLHVWYSGSEAIFDLRRMDFTEGALPSRRTRDVRAWARLHEDALWDNWERAEAGEPTYKIEPYR